MTNTEVLIERLLDAGVSFTGGEPLAPRVQPKVTGVERRSALSDWDRGLQRYTDCWCTYDGHQYFGIDILNPVADLADCGSSEFRVSGKRDNTDDDFLWVHIK